MNKRPLIKICGRTHQDIIKEDWQKQETFLSDTIFALQFKIGKELPVLSYVQELIWVSTTKLLLPIESAIEQQYQNQLKLKKKKKINAFSFHKIKIS